MLCNTQIEVISFLKKCEKIAYRQSVSQLGKDYLNIFEDIVESKKKYTCLE